MRLLGNTDCHIVFDTAAEVDVRAMCQTILGQLMLTISILASRD